MDPLLCHFHAVVFEQAPKLRGFKDFVLNQLPGDGFEFEIAEVHRCLASGLTESPTMPLAETLILAEAMDTVRAQIGLTYPGE